MKQIPLLQGKALLIELPEGAISPRVYNKFLEFDIRYSGSDGNETEGILLPPGTWQIVGMLSEVSEGEAEQIVGFGDADPSGDRFVVGHRLFDKEQEEPFLFWRDVTALESLDSAIEAAAYTFSNPYGEVEPKYDGYNYNYGFAYESPTEKKRFERDFNDWQAAQSRVLCRERTLILKKI